MTVPKRDKKGTDDGRDDSLETPLNKGFLLKNGRDDGHLPSQPSHTVPRVVLQSVVTSECNCQERLRDKSPGQRVHQAVRPAQCQQRKDSPDSIAWQRPCLSRRNGLLGLWPLLRFVAQTTRVVPVHRRDGVLFVHWQPLFMRLKEAKRLESEDSANVEVVRLTAIVESVVVAESVVPFVIDFELRAGPIGVGLHVCSTATSHHRIEIAVTERHSVTWLFRVRCRTATTNQYSLPLVNRRQEPECKQHKKIIGNKC